MTLVPLENQDVHGLEGPEFPAYKVGPVCSAPDCSRFVDHRHHLWRRSFLAGAYDWVELPDHVIVGNVVGLCIGHHDLITDNQAWIRWIDGAFWWCYPNGREDDKLYPQPPIHGQPVLDSHEQQIVGPAAAAVCPGCKRPLPRAKDDRKEGARRRKTWVVTVPADAQEDGALVLDTLLEECRSLFSHGEETNLRYFTLVQALALVVQNGHALVSDGLLPQNTTKA